MANCLYLNDSYITKDVMTYAFAKLVVACLHVFRLT